MRVVPRGTSFAALALGALPAARVAVVFVVPRRCEHLAAAEADAVNLDPHGWKLFPKFSDVFPVDHQTPSHDIHGAWVGFETGGLLLATCAAFALRLAIDS